MKKSTLMFALGLILAAMNVAAQQPVAPSSVTPTPYSAFIGKQEGVGTIDLMFEGAQSVTVNDDLQPIATMISANAAFSAKSTMSTYFKSVTCEAIEGGLRISVVGTANFGEANNFWTYSAGTNGLGVLVPEGLVTIVGADGVSHPNAATVLRYQFTTNHKVNPIGLPDNAKVSREQLAELVFPANITFGPNPGAGITLFKEGANATDAWTQIKVGNANGKYALDLGDDGLIHGKWSGDVADLEPGKYILLLQRNQISVDGVTEAGNWVFPIEIVQREEKSVQVVVARESSLEGTELPVFQVYVGGYKFEKSGVEDVTATIGDNVYSLDLAANGELTFNATDAADIKAKYLNAPAFAVTIDIPAKSLLMTAPAGEATNRAAKETFKVRVYEPIQADAVLGTYYIKNWEGDYKEYYPFSFNSQWADYGLATIAQSEEQPGMLELKNFLGRRETLYAQLDAANRRLIIPAQMYDNLEGRIFPGYPIPIGVKPLAVDEGGNIEPDQLFFSSGSQLLSPAIATIDSRGQLTMNDFSIFSYDEEEEVLQIYYEKNKFAAVPLEAVTPAAPELSLGIEYKNSFIIATFIAPTTGRDADGNTVELRNLTSYDLYVDNSHFKSHYEVNPGEEVNVCLFGIGKGYTIKVKVRANCCFNNGAFAEETFTFDALTPSQVAGDYYTVSVAGTTASIAGFPALDLPTNYTIEDKNIAVEVNNGPHVIQPITLTNLLPGISPFGEVNLYTREITFEMGNNVDVEAEEFPYMTQVENQLYGYPLYLIDGENTDVLKPATGRIVDDAIILNPAALVVDNSMIGLGRGYTAVATIDESTLVLNPHLSLIAPELNLSVVSEGESHYIKGTVTVPDKLSDGSAASSYANGHCGVNVYLLTTKAATANDFTPILVKLHEEKNLSIGDVVEFTDNTVSLGETYTYVATATYLGNEDQTQSGKTSILCSGVETVESPLDGNFDIYNLHGVKLLEGVDASALNTLAPGIYIINGVKVAIAR